MGDSPKRIKIAGDRIGLACRVRDLCRPRTQGRALSRIHAPGLRLSSLLCSVFVGLPWHHARMLPHNGGKTLDAVEQRSFEQGVTMHRYAIRNELEAGRC
ncbi:hypothetical protein GCM10023193_60400 [Planotetraspora kaengkrachanensis]|uniref:Uncharacterized protein n=1 Tax=Planotetraspora kaengkrachanensis TaxID=575193 RepID=A0A8J3V837_9ACTN|nr:hypothetical protein Pka01_56070 [Planotetraspora kaengkrachanensis]